MDYAKCMQIERRELWQSLSVGVANFMPWIIVGDFNVIRNDFEQRGGRPIPVSAIEEFNEFIETARLTDLRYEGNPFSWCNA